jgi:hypothetical protein
MPNGGIIFKPLTLQTIMFWDAPIADPEAIDMDGLFANKQKQSLKTERAFNRLLTKAQARIKAAARAQNGVNSCWYMVPDLTFTVQGFNHADCIAFLLHKLQENGFAARYARPNLILISWDHHVPTYVREEIQRRTGHVVNEHGNIVRPPVPDAPVAPVAPVAEAAPAPPYTPGAAYGDLGKNVYNRQLLERIHQKVNKF